MDHQPTLGVHLTKSTFRLISVYVFTERHSSGARYFRSDRQYDDSPKRPQRNAVAEWPGLDYGRQHRAAMERRAIRSRDGYIYPNWRHDKGKIWSFGDAALGRPRLNRGGRHCRTVRSSDWSLHPNGKHGLTPMGTSDVAEQRESFARGRRNRVP